MNQKNQKALDLLIQSLEKKQFPTDEINRYRNTLTVFLEEYLDHKTYINALESLDDFFNHFLVKKYPLMGVGLLKEYISDLKRFFTVIYGKDLITYEEYAKVFDWLVYKGDELINQYESR